MAENNRNQQSNSDQQQTGSTGQQQNSNFDNPQKGEQWDNYQTRTLSSNPERSGGDDALSSENASPSDHKNQ